jgi:glycosyltransferase involved in cell wall biosynthesis
MKISVIIPVYNKERYVEEIISRVNLINIEKEIIALNAG